MQKRFYLMILLAVFAVTGFIFPAQADEGMPIAVIEKHSYDFGSVYEGVDVIHDFTIQNKGDADLEIKNVKTG